MFNKNIVKYLIVVIPKYCNNIDVSSILDATLLFTFDLPDSLNGLEGKLKT